jgi:hypothetical protein
MANAMQPRTYPNARAERLLYDRLGPDPHLKWNVEFIDSHLVPDVGLAREVLAVVEQPEDYEIVRVLRLDDTLGPETLGFDVAQWGGSSFSLILDTMLAPQWHPAPDQDVPALVPYARQLNGHMLFSTAREARAFHDWYVLQPWAETEGYSGAFAVTRVDAVPVSPA